MTPKSVLANRAAGAGYAPDHRPMAHDAPAIAQAGFVESGSGPALPRTPGKRADTKRANRDAILRAARRVFSELGYERASVRDIIRDTGLASGTFYNYFKSKEEVSDAIADDAAHRFRLILETLRDEAPGIEDYIDRAFRAYFTFIAADFAEGHGDTRNRNRYLGAETPETLAIHAEIRAALTSAIERGHAPRIDIEFLAGACIGIGKEVGEIMLSRDPVDVEAASRFACALLLGALRSPVPGPA